LPLRDIADESHRARGVPLERSFYARPTLLVAAELPGKVLVHDSPDGHSAGVIVEVEAYIGETDPACHAAPGRTPRNLPLYGPPGRAYVYLNYGIHFLFNVVTEDEGSPAAVLVRALEPLRGTDLMRRRRNEAGGRRKPAVHELCRGPGNLACAMGITLGHNREDLCSGSLRIEDHGISVPQVAWSPRIGISVGTEHLWRCYVPGSEAVSGRKSPSSGDADCRSRGIKGRGPSERRCRVSGPRRDAGAGRFSGSSR
jgi:DNA-3-methyladenine glycosylase